MQFSDRTYPRVRSILYPLLAASSSSTTCFADSNKQPRNPSGSRRQPRLCSFATYRDPCTRIRAPVWPNTASLL